MKISEILNHLTFNELSQHRLGGYKNGLVSDEDIPKIMTTINSGIQLINTRLNLLQSIVVVKIYPEITTYTMHRDFAESNTSSIEPVKYILDTPSKPFTSKFRKFISIHDPAGNVFELNNRNNEESLGIQAYNTFQFMGDTNLKHSMVYVEYYYDPITLNITSMAEAEATEYPLPYFTAEALYYFVASKMLEGLSTETSMNSSLTELQKFENEITRLQNENSLLGDTYSNTRFLQNGWR